MSQPKSNEEIIQEFNPSEHNESVLGRYIIAYENAKTAFGISENENKKADKKINDWLRTILAQKDEEVAEYKAQLKKVQNFSRYSARFLNGTTDGVSKAYFYLRDKLTTPKE